MASAARLGQLQLTSVTSWSLRTWALTIRHANQSSLCGFLFKGKSCRQTCKEQQLRLLRTRSRVCSQEDLMISIPLGTAFVNLSACPSMCLDRVLFFACMPFCVGMCTCVRTSIIACKDTHTCRQACVFVRTTCTPFLRTYICKDM